LHERNLGWLQTRWSQLPRRITEHVLFISFIAVYFYLLLFTICDKNKYLKLEKGLEGAINKQSFWCRIFTNGMEVRATDLRD